jgi:hypothetical protein
MGGKTEVVGKNQSNRTYKKNIKDRIYRQTLARKKAYFIILKTQKRIA